MELMYPIIIVICLIIAIVICFIKFDKKEKYINGKKIANTKYIKETKYYKAKIRKYKIVSNLIKVISVITICICSFLIARPITEEITSEYKFNRDIFLSIDLSGSQNEVNLELVKKFRDIIPEIEGDRIGIVIFNTAPVVYCPLTDDYEFIDDCLKNMEEQLKRIIDNDGMIPIDLYDQGVNILFNSGVVDDYETKGSSLIGDGLARNNIFFSRFKKRPRKNENYYFCN